MKGKSEEKINIPSNSKKYHIYKNSYDRDQLEKNIPLKNRLHYFIFRSKRRTERFKISLIRRHFS